MTDRPDTPPAPTSSAPTVATLTAEAATAGG